MRSRLAKVQTDETAEIREPDADQIRRMIAEAAYYRAEKRGFVPGMEAADWCAAEAEVMERVRADASRI